MKVEVVLLWWLFTFNLYSWLHSRLHFRVHSWQILHVFHFELKLLPVYELHLVLHPQLLGTLVCLFALNRLKLVILVYEVSALPGQPRDFYLLDIVV